MHARVLPQLQRRTTMLDAGTIDWATAETLAVGSLLLDGVAVRLAGQDSRRGTFGQRHAVLTDRRTGAEHTPLSSLGPRAADFAPYDSMLSELGALAFEYGYSLARPDALVLWEAQFGDFANGAQAVIDEYIASSEQKWGQRSGLMLVAAARPGRAGARPLLREDRAVPPALRTGEHDRRHALPAGQLLPSAQAASARRAQKATGRLHAEVDAAVEGRATSGLTELTMGAFRAVIPDETADTARIRRVLVCSGKVFYDLDAHRRSAGLSDTAIVRLERVFTRSPRRSWARNSPVSPPGPRCDGCRRSRRTKAHGPSWSPMCNGWRAVPSDASAARQRRPPPWVSARLDGQQRDLVTSAFQ